MKTNLLSLLFILLITSFANGATFVVTSSLDYSANPTVMTLRRAIELANTNADVDTITFNIPPAFPQVSIYLQTPLPNVENPITIDGTTQPGYAGKPVIELNGGLVSSGHGLYISNTTGCKVLGLAIIGFEWSGIQIAYGGGHLIASNHIGTDVDGTFAIGNQMDGINIYRAPNNVISNNVISGNAHDGIAILNSVSQNNLVVGNVIGLGLSGMVAIPNGNHGVSLSGITTEQDFATLNTVGGYLPEERNVISGNSVNNVQIFRGAQNKVIGNFIGTDKNGQKLAAQPATSWGVSIVGGSDNLIGGADLDDGAADGFVAARNVISGHVFGGVVMDSDAPLFPSITFARLNRVQGNFVGTDATGAASITNGIGIELVNGAAENFVGGSTSGAGNLISGNSLDGVLILSGSSNNVVLGNKIGTSAVGTASLANGRLGIGILDSSHNRIGGVTENERNLISGNSVHGIFVGKGSLNKNSTKNLIQGNFIGTDIGGTNPIPNLVHGVYFREATNNTLGGDIIGAGNLISANGSNGVHLLRTESIKIEGNAIGTAFNRLHALGNEANGISIYDSVTTLIGGSVPALRNVISANQRSGIHFGTITTNDSSSGTVIRGNFIGTANDGVTALGNFWHGVFIEEGKNNLIGGVDPGESNVIAFNGQALGPRGHAVVVAGTTNSVGNTIRGNSIYDNSGRGIDLGNNSFDVNDVTNKVIITSGATNQISVRDEDEGPNRLINYPVVTKVRFTPTRKYVNWTWYPHQGTYALDVYTNNAADASGFGEGRYLAETGLASI